MARPQKYIALEGASNAENIIQQINDTHGRYLAQIYYEAEGLDPEKEDQKFKESGHFLVFIPAEDGSVEVLVYTNGKKDLEKSQLFDRTMFEDQIKKHEKEIYTELRSVVQPGAESVDKTPAVDPTTYATLSSPEVRRQEREWQLWVEGEIRDYAESLDPGMGRVEEDVAELMSDLRKTFKIPNTITDEIIDNTLRLANVSEGNKFKAFTDAIGANVRELATKKVQEKIEAEIEVRAQELEEMQRQVGTDSFDNLSSRDQAISLVINTDTMYGDAAGDPEREKYVIMQWAEADVRLKHRYAAKLALKQEEGVEVNSAELWRESCEDLKAYEKVSRMQDFEFSHYLENIGIKIEPLYDEIPEVEQGPILESRTFKDYREVGGYGEFPSAEDHLERQRESDYLDRASSPSPTKVGAVPPHEPPTLRSSKVSEASKPTEVDSENPGDHYEAEFNARQKKLAEAEAAYMEVRGAEEPLYDDPGEFRSFKNMIEWNLENGKSIDDIKAEFVRQVKDNLAVARRDYGIPDEVPDNDLMDLSDDDLRGVFDDHIKDKVEKSWKEMGEYISVESSVVKSSKVPPPPRPPKDPKSEVLYEEVQSHVDLKALTGLWKAATKTEEEFLAMAAEDFKSRITKDGADLSFEKKFFGIDDSVSDEDLKADPSRFFEEYVKDTVKSHYHPIYMEMSAVPKVPSRSGKDPLASKDMKYSTQITKSKDRLRALDSSKEDYPDKKAQEQHRTLTLYRQREELYRAEGEAKSDSRMLERADTLRKKLMQEASDPSLLRTSSYEGLMRSEDGRSSADIERDLKADIDARKEAASKLDIDSFDVSMIDAIAECDHKIERSFASLSSLAEHKIVREIAEKENLGFLKYRAEQFVAEQRLAELKQDLKTEVGKPGAKIEEIQAKYGLSDLPASAVGDYNPSRVTPATEAIKERLQYKVKLDKRAEEIFEEKKVKSEVAYVEAAEELSEHMFKWGVNDKGKIVQKETPVSALVSAAGSTVAEVKVPDATTIIATTPPPAAEVHDSPIPPAEDHEIVDRSSLRDEAADIAAGIVPVVSVVEDVEHGVEGGSLEEKVAKIGASVKHDAKPDSDDEVDDPSVKEPVDHHSKDKPLGDKAKAIATTAAASVVVPEIPSDDGIDDLLDSIDRIDLRDEVAKETLSFAQQKERAREQVQQAIDSGPKCREKKSKMVALKMKNAFLRQNGEGWRRNTKLSA